MCVFKWIQPYTVGLTLPYGGLKLEFAIALLGTYYYMCDPTLRTVDY